METEVKLMYLGDTVRIAIRIGKGSAIMSGQLVSIDFIEHNLCPLRCFAPCDDSDFIGRCLVQERPDDGEGQVEDSRCCQKK